jgi:MFS family permease
MAPPDAGDPVAATIYGMATDGGPASGAGPLRLLGANRPFRLLWSARAVSFLGDSLSLVALMLHVAETTGQALAVAWLLLAGDFAPALLGPLTGTVADRLDRRRVMVGCELLQGALVVVIALWLPALPLLLVLVGLRAVAGQVFQPASRAAVPAVVPERDLERANAAVGAATNGGEALGPLVAAVALPVLEIRGVLLVDAASFLVSAALLGLLPPLARSGDGDPARPASFLADAGAGLRYLRGQPILRVVVGGYVAVAACTGIDDVALVFLATDTFGAGESAAGLLLAAVGIGLLAGYALLARTGGRAPIDRGTTPAVPRTPRRPRGCWPASPSAPPATCSPGWPGRSRPPWPCRPSAGSASPPWTWPPPPWSSGSRPQPSRAGVRQPLRRDRGRRRPVLPAGRAAAGPDDAAGGVRGRRGRRPAGHRRHRPGPAAGRELTYMGVFPRDHAKRTFIAVGAPANGGWGWASVERVWSSERCWWR